jgi:predicted Zn-dependent protease
VLDNLAGFGFNGKSFARRQSFAELGAEQLDKSVTLLDEPIGIVGAPSPDLPFDTEGTPRSTLALVQDGTTVGITHDRASAAEVGMTSTGHASPESRNWGPTANHLRLVPDPKATVGEEGSGPVAASSQALVAGMERGLLITDFWYTRVLDQKSLVITGLTRNGVWLVENGEVTAAVSNMRFTQSYPQALGPGLVLGIGGEAVQLPDRWSGVRYSAPALRLASWNLTGNASG